MENEEITLEFNNFIKNYEWDKVNRIWENNKSKFQDFWYNRMGKGKDIPEADMDEIIRILDKNAKGNKGNESVAKAMIPQGVWRRMFSDMNSNMELYSLISNIFKDDGLELIEKIDRLYELNKENKNGLTGKSGNAINALLVANSPEKFISVISLNERERIIKFFGFEDSIDFEKDSQGRKIFFSNKTIIEGFNNLGISASPRTITAFLYSDQIKQLWRNYSSGWGGGRNEEITDEYESSEEEMSLNEESKNEFNIEKELENFLIKNWERIELGEKYELILDDEGMPSQQYRIGKWKIDILARNKENKEDYLIIELKKGRAPDQVIGQICRYMSYVKKHIVKNNGTVSGMIISSIADEELRYAIEQVQNVELKTYKIDFKLKEVERI